MRETFTWRPFACAVLGVLAAVGCTREDSRLAALRELQERQQFAETVEPLQAFLAANPDDAEANYLLGVALAHTGRPSSAVWPLLKASSAPSYAAKAGTRLANVLLATGNSDEAVRVAQRTVAAAPDNLEARRVLSAALMSARKPAEALTEVDAVLQQEPENVRALAIRAIALIALEREADAERAYQKLEAVTRNDDDVAVAAEGCLALARFYAEVKKDEGRDGKKLDECVERFPSNIPTLQAVSRFYDGTEPQRVDAIWQRAVAAEPKNFALRAALAQRFEDAGRVADAEKTWQAAAEEIGTPTSWQLLADFQRRQRNPEAALAALERASADAGNRAELLRFTQADLFAETGDFDRAAALVNSLTDPSLRRIMEARLLVARGEDQQALAVFDEAFPLWPNNPGARLLAAQAAERVGDFDRAQIEYRAAVRSGLRNTDAALAAAQLHFALGEYESALEFAQLHARTHPGMAAPYIIGARAAGALGRDEVARRLLEQLAEIDGEKVTALVEQAALERRSAGPMVAIRLIRQSGLDLTDPANEAALRVLADNLVADGDTRSALEEIDRALARSPASVPLYDLRGRTLAARGDRVGAQAAFERALELMPEYAPALEGLGTLAAKAGTVDPAVALFDRAAAAAPPGLDSRYHSAQVLLAAGRPDDARQRLEDLVREAPNFVSACNDLAWILAEQSQDLPRALELAQRATRLSRDANALDTLGWVQLKMGRTADAKRSFEQALTRNPTSVQIHAHLELLEKKQ